MKYDVAQIKANKAKHELIQILNDFEVDSKKSQKLKDDLEKIIIKLEVWQNKK